MIRKSAFYFLALVLSALPPVFAKEKPALTSQRLGGNYRFINPLLECEDESGLTLLTPFQHKLDKFVKSRLKKNVNHIAIYYRDLKNGPWFGINESEGFTPASLLKVPIMMSYYLQAEQEPDILAKTLKVDKLGGYNAGVVRQPSQEIKAGEAYTIDELIRRMIIYSDNEATALLCGDMSQDVFSRTYRDLGIEIPEIRKPQDFMTVKEYGSFFRILYNASYLNKKMSEKALDLLSQSEFKEGIAAGVPSSVAVAHKFGERVFIDPSATGPQITQLHDCGIVYFPNRPYLLCVMTRGPNVQDLIGILQDVSKLVYRELDDQISKSK